MRWLKLLIIVPLVAGLAALAYYTSEHFRTRVDDTVHVLKVRDVRGVNISTYALLSNGYTSFRMLKQHPLFGVGLGAHKLAQHLYISRIPGARYFGKYMLNSSANDANSLLLRAGSELGAVGLCLIGWFLYRFHVRGSSVQADISAACIIYFALKLLRDGHWFSPEMYFFVWTYVLVWREARSEGRGNVGAGLDSIPGTSIASVMPR